MNHNKKPRRSALTPVSRMFFIEILAPISNRVILKPDLERLTIPLETSLEIFKYVLAKDAKTNNKIKTGNDFTPAFLP